MNDLNFMHMRVSFMLNPKNIRKECLDDNPSCIKGKKIDFMVGFTWVHEISQGSLCKEED